MCFMPGLPRCTHHSTLPACFCALRRVMVVGATESTRTQSWVLHHGSLSPAVCAVVLVLLSPVCLRASALQLWVWGSAATARTMFWCEVLRLAFHMVVKLYEIQMIWKHCGFVVCFLRRWFWSVLSSNYSSVGQHSADSSCLIWIFKIQTISFLFF